jgi:hypothetical protein
MAYCEQLTQSKQVAFECEIFTLKSGTQIMSFTFPDVQTLSHYWQSITDNLAVHYCITSNDMNINASIGQIVIKEDAVRMYYCQSNKWDVWKKADIQKYSNTGNQRY